MAELERVSKIKQESLSGEHYFQSLLEQAYAEELLTGAEIEKLQLDCLALLAKSTERFNNGSSSSIRVEKAQDILESVLFTIGVQLKTFSSPDDAVAALQRAGVEAAFAEGQRQIERQLKRNKMRHAALLGRLLPSKNVYYHATLVDGIKGFFQLYRPEFAAQEIHITADYPVYNKAEQLQGVEFIAQYLLQLSCENAFCMHFAPEAIHHLLCGCDEHYEELLFNLYEPVLATALGCVLAGANAEQLEITPQIQAFLHHRLSGKNCTEIQQMLATALLELGGKLGFSESLLNYASQSLPQLAATIESSLKTGTLDRVFIAPSYPEERPKLIVCYGERMPDELYREVVDEFISCQTMPDKIRIMKENIHSLADLNDLLLDAEPEVEQIVTLFRELSFAEVTALMKKYCSAYEMSFSELRDAEKTLYEGLQAFAATLPPAQQALLKKAVQALEVDEDSAF